MSKKLESLKWESVALEGFPISMSDKFQGFVGLEECTDYGFDKENKKAKKKKPKNKKTNKPEIIEIAKKGKKRQNTDKSETSAHVAKKVKLNNGFTVENCNSTSPSLTNELEKKSITTKSTKNNVKETKIDVLKKQKSEASAKVKNIKNLNPEPSLAKNEPLLKKNLKKPKLGEHEPSTSSLSSEDMLSWAEFKLPDELTKALAELGFKQPTKIQQLSLPAAIHGRRDILGAAETGSGKTLAFGLPILSGIMKLKEKALDKGLDVYDIPYKKSSFKKHSLDIKDDKQNRKNQKERKVKNVEKSKESSEDGYSSGSNEDDKETSKESSEEDFIEEIDVPLRKKEESADEGNDSDDDNYIHLSDMLDDEDFADSSADEKDESLNNGSNAEEGESDEGKTSDADDENDMSDGDQLDEEDDNETEEIGDINEVDKNGIGCVKVLDNVEIPGHVSIKTGKPLYALILTPTRELAIQISRHLIAAAKYTGIRIATIVGGMAAVKQERVLRSGPEVVVATPGRLWELITQGQPHLQQLSSVKFLAIDETDRMVERGHFEELQPLLERLNADEDHKSSRQNFVFSATLTMVHDLPAHMRGKKVTKRGKIINRKVEKMTPQQKIKKLITMIGMTDPKVVDITTKNLGTADTLTECRIVCSMDDKDAYLYYVLKRHPGRTIVFCNSIGSVKRLAQLFALLKCRPLPLHASMPQRQRLKNLERFRDDPNGVLVATDVAARGLDIPNVDHVIHYQVPRTAENYVHRSGRTARATKEGLTILMMEPAEAFSYTKLCRTLNKTSELPSFPVQSQCISALKDIVVCARELDGVMLRRRRASTAASWREKAARDMDMIIDEDDIPITKVDPGLDKAVHAKRKQLDALLSRPLFPKGFSFKYPTLNEGTSLMMTTDENALQAVKKAIETGELKKQKRKSKNESLLKLQKIFKK